ncbi:MAG: DsbA family protein [Kofleriaceae bacterium]|nr:DsbA family protein [Kofleriaceae bacterium]MCB9570765.1 DsbA family protein [Kofleriaceae bacterium]
MMDVHASPARPASARAGRLAALIALATLAACGRAAAPAPTAAAPLSNQAVAAAPTTTGGDGQYAGNPDASVRLTYWFDYECPFCVQAGPVLDQVEARYGDRIVVYYRNFPLSQHHGARPAAIAAEAARRQGRYLEMYRLLIAISPRFEPADLRDAAAQLGLDLDRFDADVADPAAGAAIDAEYAAGERAGLVGVPTLQIDGVDYTGDFDVDAISRELDARLGR